MTTPQSILYDIKYKVNEIQTYFEGEEEPPRRGIVELIRDIEVEVSECNERMKLLEDKMNLIIKVLGKPSND
jgi:hypothetical protein